MTLHEQIKSQIKEAMLAKDSVRLETLRGILSAFTNELVAKGMKPQELLADEMALSVLTKLSKQRKDSIEQFSQAGRMELVEEENAQLKIIEGFLPTLMTKEEIIEFVQNKKDQVDMTQNKGQITGFFMKELKGKADGVLVKAAVEELF